MRRLWIGLIISVAALALLVRSIELDVVIAMLADVQAMPLFGALLLVLAQVILVSLRWTILLPTAPTGRRVPAVQVVGPVFIGYLGNLVLPARLGEAARAYLVARRGALHLSATLGSVVLERLVDAATGAIVALILAITLGAPDWVVQLTAIAAIGALVLFGVLTLIGLRPLVGLLDRLADGGDARIPPRVTRGLARFVDGLRIGGRRPAILLAAFMSTGNWLVEGTIYWLVAVAIGLDVTPAAALLVATVTVLATAIPSAPGYLGTFELAAVAITGAFGIAASPAFAFALLVHVVTVLPLAAGGLVALIPVGVSFGPLREAAMAAERVTIDGG